MCYQRSAKGVGWWKHKEAASYPDRASWAPRKGFLEVLLELVLEEQLEVSQVVGKERWGEKMGGNHMVIPGICIVVNGLQTS